jgi:hypothetical protein
MALLKNKRGVEALPLRYIIIALVAALVIGIALQFVGILKTTTIGAANQYGAMTNATIICETDKTGPTVNQGWLCNSTTYDTNCGNTTINNGTSKTLHVFADATDNQGGCGIDDYNGVFAWVYKNGASINTSVPLTRQSGNIFHGTYTESAAGNYYVVIYAVDNSTTMNAWRTINQTNNLTVS